MFEELLKAQRLFLEFLAIFVGVMFVAVLLAWLLQSKFPSDGDKGNDEEE